MHTRHRFVVTERIARGKLHGKQAEKQRQKKQ